jgi:hypothetical protein
MGQEIRQSVFSKIHEHFCTFTRDSGKEIRETYGENAPKTAHSTVHRGEAQLYEVAVFPVCFLGV